MDDVIGFRLSDTKVHTPCADGCRSVLRGLGKKGVDDDFVPLTFMLSLGAFYAAWAFRVMPQHDDLCLRWLNRALAEAGEPLCRSAAGEAWAAALQVVERCRRRGVSEERLRALLVEEMANDAAV